MRDAKASFAHSAQGTGIGRRSPVAAFAAATALALGLALVFASVAGASKNVVGHFGSAVGYGGNQFSGSGGPNAGAVNADGAGAGANLGDMYLLSFGSVEHISNGPDAHRIEQFDAFGNYIREWGWDTVLSGPGDTGPDEQQSITIPGSATAGTFQIKVVVGVGAEFLNNTGGVPLNQINNVQVDTGSFRVGDTIESTNAGALPADTTILDVDPTGTLITISNNRGNIPGSTLTTSETTAPIPYNADASTVQAALEGLDVIDPGDVTVSGGPGGTSPFTVTFNGGLLAHDDVAPMQIINSVTGGAPAVATVANGGGFEICNAGDVCKFPAAPAPPGPGSTTPGGALGGNGTTLAVEPATGNVLAGELSSGGRDRVSVFGSDGTFQGVFGWGVSDGNTNALQFCTGTSCQAGAPSPSGANAGNNIAFDPSTGHLFMAGTNQIDEYSLSHDLSGAVTGASFVRALGEDVVASGPDNNGTGFEICDPTVDTCKVGIVSPDLGSIGISDLGTPGPLAVDSHGVVYLNANYQSFDTRVQSFTPGPTPGSPPYTTYTPADFDPADLHSSNGGGGAEIGGFAIAPGDDLLATKPFAQGASICPGGSIYGSSSPPETRVLEISPGGTLQDTHAVCAGVGGNTLVSNSATGVIYLGGTKWLTSKYTFSDPKFPGVFVLAAASSPTTTINSVTPNTSGATVTAVVNPQGPTDPFLNLVTTAYQVEYKKSSDSTWTSFGNPIDIGAGTADHDVTIHVGALDANTSYDLRIVATKPGFANGVSGVETFNTLPTPPTIDALSSSGVTASSADLHASINAHGTDTTYHFNYGPTTDYGQSTPETDIGNSLSPQAVIDHIDGLNPIVYHFQVVGHNDYGTVLSKDQTFTFYPPPCPNETLRQQNGSSYLPDCRGYEIVSPGDAGSVVLFDAAWAAAPYAVSPARFGFAGGNGAITGTDPPNGFGADTYIATRTDAGWVTKFTGYTGDQGSVTAYRMNSLTLDKALWENTFLDAGIGTDQPPHHIPEVFDADGNHVGPWPTGVASVPNGESTSGGFQPSPDFSHMAFSSQNIDFDPNHQGVTSIPGSAYDYDMTTGITTLISKTAAGTDIPAEPANAFNPFEVIQFPGDSPGTVLTTNGTTVPTLTAARIHPGVSTSGSHILMSTARDSADGAPTRLYMSVNDAVHYDVSEGHDVHYVGMTDDGTRVFFTSDEDLTSDNSDTDSSTDLYMWSENNGTPTITDLSKGSGGTGNSDDCHAGWTTGCNVGGVVGSGGGLTDYPVATQSGNVYFYSPELLDGPANGIENGQNLYVYRNGSVHFVTALKADGSQPVLRVNVSPNGEHAAFLTASRLTSYDNAGFAELYTFDPSSGGITCVSCLPSGDPPTTDVTVSKSFGTLPNLTITGGLFMSNDGRSFFSTTDPLVDKDTNNGFDVYEYVEGRPQLITSGTGATHYNFASKVTPQFFSGVSADGVNVYFGTYDTLVSQDHNGAFLKFYDARTGGGFPPEANIQPCVAADECHGPDSLAPSASGIATRTDLGSGGNATRVAAHRKKHHKKRHHRHKRAHSRRHNARKANANRGRSQR